MARTCLFHTLGRCAGSCPGASSRTPLPGTARLPGCSLTPHVCKPGESTDRSCDGRLHYSYCLRDKGPGYLCPCLGPHFAQSLQGSSTTHTSSSSTCRMLVRYFQVPPLLQAHSLPLSLHSPVNREVQSQCACTRNAGYSALGWEIFTPAGSLGQPRDMWCAGLTRSASPACGYPGSH